MFYEESKFPPTLIGAIPTTGTDFALKNIISEQRQNFAKQSFVTFTEISSGSSSWAVAEEFGSMENIIDVSVTNPQNDTVLAFSRKWVESDNNAIVRVLKETTQTIKDIKKDSVLTIIEEIRKSKSIAHSDQIANRLYQLNDDVIDDYPEVELISPDSLLDYYLFLKINKNLTFPAITATPQGKVWVQWESSINQHFSVEFKGQGEVVFVVFAPDPVVPSKINRVSGIGTIYSLMTQAQAYNVSSWMFIKEKVA